MPTPDERKPSGGWSVDTGMQHTLSLIGANDHRYEQRFKDIEQRFADAQRLVEMQYQAHRDAVNLALSAADRAVNKAEAASEKRFDSINEFRGTLADQQRTLMPRAESDRAFAAVAEKMAALEKLIDAVAIQHSQIIAEKRGAVGGWGAAVAAVGFVLTIVTLIVIVAKLYATP